MRERYGISRRDEVDALYPRMRDAHRYLRGERDPAKEKKKSPAAFLRPFLGAGVGAGLTGLLTGRLNHWNFPGTPLPIGLTLAVAGQAVDYFDLLGPVSQDFGNAGIGAFASWINMLSTGVGQQWRASSGLPVGDGQPLTAGVAGMIGACGPTVGCGPIGCAPAALPPRPIALSEAQVAAMSHTMRRAA